MTPSQPPKSQVILFLSGLRVSDANSAARIAELMTVQADLREGTYAIEAIGSPSAHLFDGRPIVRTDTDTDTPAPVVDIHTVWPSSNSG